MNGQKPNNNNKKAHFFAKSNNMLYSKSNIQYQINGVIFVLSQVIIGKW